MKLFGITGWKDSGKTTLVEQLVATLSQQGFSVATIKHAHHAFDIDHPGKDSYRHRSAGAKQVLVASRQRWALMREIADEPEPSLDDLVAKLDPVDIVIVEGFKRSQHPKLAVVRPSHNPAPLPEQAPLVAIASDTPLDPADYSCHGPVFMLDDVSAIVTFIIDYCELSPEHK